MQTINTLTFGKGNAKLGKTIATFSLPSGFTCPGALECLSKANRETGKITDGKATKFRCFSASQEATYKNVRESRWSNFELLQKASREACETLPLPDTVMALESLTAAACAMANLILESLPKRVEKVRVHVSGDFYNQAYFDAWLIVAAARPDVVFYAYTKSLKFWIARLNQIPSNLHLNASFGGIQDNAIAEHKLKSARVVFSVKEAADLGLEIDHDDSHAYSDTGSFALLIHGTQPKGSEAGAAARALKGLGSYGRGTKAKA